MLSNFYDAIKLGIASNDWYSLLFLILGSAILYLITLRIVLPIIYYLIERSPTDWDNMLIKYKVLSKLVLVPSLFFVSQFSYLLPQHTDLIGKLLTITFVWLIVLAFDRFMIAVNAIYERLPYAKGKPLKGYIQVIEIIIFLFGIITIISIILGRSPWVLLSGLGAISAVLMLIFKDTILSFVASVRITSNKLIELGDWVEMPQYGADGDVIDIALHNIQIQNWDKTITSIPTHKLLEDSFKNWKGMTRAGGRRIMRNVNIDIASIGFCDDETSDKYAKIHYLKDYIEDKKRELTEYNKRLGIKDDDLVNGRHMTNIGTFRAYAERYLRNHPGINQNLIMMVRQMEPGPNGVPIQIYAFTNDTAWPKYEAIQADIFDHLFAVIPSFGLRVYQLPSGKDLQLFRDQIT